MARSRSPGLGYRWGYLWPNSRYQKMYGSSSSTAMQQLINLCSQNNMQARGFNPTIDQRQNFNYTLASDIEISYILVWQMVTKNMTHCHWNNFFMSEILRTFIVYKGQKWIYWMKLLITLQKKATNSFHMSEILRTFIL